MRRRGCAAGVGLGRKWAALKWQSQCPISLLYKATVNRTFQNSFLRGTSTRDLLKLEILMWLNAQVQRAGCTGTAPPHLCGHCRRHFEAIRATRIVFWNLRYVNQYAFLLLLLLSDDSEGGGRVKGRDVCRGIHVTQDCVGFDAPTVVCLCVCVWGGGGRERERFSEMREHTCSPKTV